MMSNRPKIYRKPECQNECDSIKFIKKDHKGRSYYQNGAVLCDICGWLSLPRFSKRCCPCCGFQLRISPKKNTSRHKLNNADEKRY